MKFHDNMANQSLKAFANVSTNTARGKKTQEVILKADRNLFSHMLLVAESRKVNVKDVLDHPLGSLSWAMANADESLRKTKKAALPRPLKRMSPLQKTSLPHLLPSLMV